MLKNIVFAFMLMMGLSISSTAQVGSGKQVSWASSAKKMGDKMYEVRITATIAGNYHMYAQVAGVEGPLPTTFSFIPNPLLTLSGKVLEQGKKITKREDAWDGNVNYYEKTATFIQIVRVNTKAKTNLNGKVEFMVCNDELCLPPSEFTFKIPIGG
jgi:thiol:disulfide interchange protein DsbD